MGRRERCTNCAGTGKRLVRAPEHHLPNGRAVQSVPYWEDCDECDGTGQPS